MYQKRFGMIEEVICWVKVFLNNVKLNNYNAKTGKKVSQVKNNHIFFHVNLNMVASEKKKLFSKMI